MANNEDRYNGLVAVKHLNGNPWNGAVFACNIKAAVTNAIGVNSPVLLQGNADARGIPDVDIATVGDGNYISGVVSGFKADPTDLDLNYRSSGAKSKDRICYVCMDPDVIYQINDDGAAALTAADVGLNANLIRTHAVSASTGVSGDELDTNSDPPAADASNQLLILRLADIEGNDIGKNAIWEVLINMHSLRTPALGV